MGVGVLIPNQCLTCTLVKNTNNFFSSRRRDTRFDCDWSSDVCSSDLVHETRGPTVPMALWKSFGTGRIELALDRGKVKRKGVREVELRARRPWCFRCRRPTDLRRPNLRPRAS